jgi:DNA invertase Pin-like site-specific DNA recombinase
MKMFVSYCRVSTQAQGRSGLGLDAQQAAVAGYLTSVAGSLAGEFVEVETGKGSNALERRPQLRAALELCKKSHAILLIAKLDRLARNVHFVSGLIETSVEFVAADMPQANKVMLQMHAVMAEWERDQISTRTRSALAAAKARGVRLGVAGASNLRPGNEARQRAADAFAANLGGLVEGFRLRALSQRQMVGELNRLSIATPRGKTWGLLQVQLLLKRLNAPDAVSGVRRVG